MRKGKFRFRNRFIVVIVVFFLTILALGLLANVASALPVIVATKRDILVVDNDGDGVADPGDTIRYSIRISNVGTTDATGATFDDTIDGNTTLVSGSVRTTPIARHDFYNVLGNVGITVPAANGVLANDNDPDGQSISVFSAPSTSTFGGAVAVAADGSFTYDPPPGFEGSDGFNYSVIDTDGNIDWASVFLSISDMVWFVDNSASSSNLGTFNNPFTSITAFNASSAPDPGDSIFIYQGNGAYVDGIVLQNSQLLFGQGVDLLAQLAAPPSPIIPPTFSDLNAGTNPPSGNRPTLTDAAGDGVTLAANNLVRGLDIGNTGGVGIGDGGGSAGTVFVDQVAIGGHGGGIEIDNGGTLSVLLDSLSASSSTDEGIHLAGVNGSFAVAAAGGAINATGVPAISIDGNPTLALNVNLTGVSSSGAANGISIQDTSGLFTVTGSGGSCTSEASCTGGTIKNTSGDGISLQNAMGISLNHIFIDSSGGQGINGTSVTNFALANSTVTRCGNAVSEGCLKMVNLAGTASITDSDLSFPAERVAQIANSTGTLVLVVSDSTFRDAQASSTGADTLEITSNGNADTTIDIVDSSFLRYRTNGLQVFSEGNATVNLDVTGSTFDVGADNADPNVYDDGIGMDLSANDSGMLNFNILNNPLISSRGGIAINSSAFSDANIQGRIMTNTVTFEEDPPAFGGSIFGIDLKANDNSTAVYEVRNNTLTGDNAGYGIRAIARLAGSSRMDATIDSNNVTNIGPNGLYAIWVQAGTSAAGENNTTCANVTNNSSTTPPPLGYAFRAREASGTLLLQGFNTNATTTWNNNGNTPAGLVSESGAISGGTCLTVGHPLPSPAPSPLAVSDPDFSLAQAKEEGAVLIALSSPAENRTAHVIRTALAAQPARLMPAYSGESVFLDLGTMNAGQVVLITFQVTVDNDIPASATLVCNQGLFQGTNFTDVLTDDPTTGAINDATCTAVEISRVDLVMTKSDDGVSVAAGGTIAYTLHFTNTGQVAATGVVVTDTVPAGTTFNADDSAAGWSCSDGDPAGSVCVYNVDDFIGPVNPGSNNQLDFAVAVDSSVPAFFPNIQNTVEIGDDGAAGPDQNPGDNSDTELTPVIASPDLQVSKSDQGTAPPGSTLSYTIVYTNAGGRASNSTIISETVPAYTTWDPANSTAGWSCNPPPPDAVAGTNCTINVGIVNGAGAGGTVVFAVTVDSTLPAGVAQTTNYVDIYGISNTADSNPDDNSFSLVTELNRPPEINDDDLTLLATSINENDSASLSGVFVDPDDGNSHSVTINWGDGSNDTVVNLSVGARSFSADHQYLDDNPSGTAFDDYDIHVTVTDDANGSDAAGTVVTVTNLNPTLSNVAIIDVNENGMTTLTGNIADVGTQDTFTLTVSWGDLSATSIYTYPAGLKAFTETHQYLDDNPSGTAFDDYTVDLTLTDDDTGTDVDSTTVTVTNLNPTLSNVAIIDVNENGVTTLTGNIADVGTQDTFTLTVSWGDLSATSIYTYPAGLKAFTETHQYLDDNPSGTAFDDYTVDLTLTDDDTGTDVDSTTVTVTNLNPTLSNVAIIDVNENGVTTLTGNIADVGTQDTFTLTVSWGDLSATSIYTYPAGTTTFTETHQYLDDNPSGTASDPYTVGLTLTDDDTGQTTGSTVVTVSNVVPALSADVPTQTLQYSDIIANVTITATDVAGDPLQASSSWNVDGGAFVAGLPAGMNLTTNSCFFVGNLRTCTWTLSGVADVIAGNYIVRLTVDDDDLGQSNIDLAIVVTPEDAQVAFPDSNPVSVPVASDGGDSGPFTLNVDVTEFDDPDDVIGDNTLAGNISLAQVTMTLVPVGPGGSESPQSCTTSVSPGLSDPDSPHDYDILTVSCDFEDVPVNTYVVQVSVGGGYYTGAGEDVLTVYDPSLGFTSGGGWFYWPGTADAASGYPGDRTNFGYTMKYNKNNLKNVKGSLLLIRHASDGSIYRIKSNALDSGGLAIGDAGFFGWASFTGKANYVHRILETDEPEGNHSFLAYVEDHDEPGNGIDKFWIETRGKDGLVILDLSMTRPGSANAEQISGGNIIVPHTGGTGNQQPAADFSYEVSGLTVSFTGQSSDPGGQVVEWLWDFGDGNTDNVENPTHSYEAAGSYDVTLTVTDNNGATDSVTHQVIVNSGSTAEMYVGDLSGSSAPQGKKWAAHVTILILDEFGNPIADAQVTGSWSDGASGSSSCLTNSSGICTVTKTQINGRRTNVTFTVDDVTHNILGYNPSLNVKSSIVVPQP